MSWQTYIRSAPNQRVTTRAPFRVAEALERARQVLPHISRDHYTAARLCASEHASGSPEELAAIIDAELNRAQRKGDTLTEHLAPEGFYGPLGSGRVASTRRDPKIRHYRAAVCVLGADGPGQAAVARAARGIAKGAERFFDPRAMDRQNRNWILRGRTGRPAVSCTALGILRRWSFGIGEKCEGWSCCPGTGEPLPGADENPADFEEWIGDVGGIDAYRLMLMRPSQPGPGHAAAYRRARNFILTRRRRLQTRTLVASAGGLLVVAGALL